MVTEPPPPRIPRIRVRRRRSQPRAKVIARKKLTGAVRAAAWLELGMSPDTAVELTTERPRTRAECVDGPRPCPWVACREHFYLDINPETGSIKINFPHLEVWELKETCVLDVAERGGITLEEVGVIMNLTRERIRQVEVRGLLELKTKCEALGIDDPAFPHATHREAA